MKALAISLLVLVGVLLANVLAIFVSPEYKTFIQSKISSQNVSKPPTNESTTALESTIDKLTYGIEALSRTGSTIATSTGVVIPAPAVMPPAIIVPPPKLEPVIFPLTIALQAKLLPNIFSRVSQNKGIFDIRIFTDTNYTTYRDDKNRVNIYAFEQTYPVILSQLKLVSNVYSVRETDTFLDASFFLNPTNKRDTTIRFVTSIGGKAYGFEVPNSYYPRIKKLLTNK